ncbi:Esterase, partial [Hyphodiscus hymeniophilus]
KCPIPQDVGHQTRSEKFRPDAVSEDDRKTLEIIKSMPRDEPWWEIGMDEYRRREQAGELLYKPRLLTERAKVLMIPSREPGRMINCRVFHPALTANRGKTRVLLNIHGGGWTVFSNKFQDPYLAHVADVCNHITLSVGYRLGPEFPFPAGPEDCFDVVVADPNLTAEWLIVNSVSQLGAPFEFIDGSVGRQCSNVPTTDMYLYKSSGGHFAALTALHLRKSYPSFHLRGLVLKYGIFDLTYTNPSIVNATDPIIVTRDALKHTTEALVPRTSLQERQSPSISPFYADLRSLTPLPPALFVCGTEDILIDDSVFFAAKWMMVISESAFKVLPGALHGFVDFEGMPFMKEGWDTITKFLVNLSVCEDATE